MPPERQQPLVETNRRALGLIFLAAVMWSTSGLLIKIIQLDPLTIAGLRGLIAGSALLVVTNRRLKLTWSAPQLAGAVAYATTMLLFVSATKMTTAANAILLQYTMPVYTALFGAWLLREKVTPRDWAAITIVLGGMALFFFDRLSTGGMIGNIMAILSGVTFALIIIFMRMQKEGSPLETVILGNLLTALVCLPWIVKAPPAPADWWPLLYLGLFQLGLPFLIYSRAIKQVSALDAVLVQTVEPLLNPIWVFLVIGEVPGSWAIAGGAVVICVVTYRNMRAGQMA